MASVNGKEYKLAVRIAGTVDKSLGLSIAGAKTSLKALNSDFEKMDKVYDKITGSIAKVGATIVKGLVVATTAATTFAVASTKAASEFESAFAGVKKTVDATDEEFAMLREDIIGLTRDIPSTASEIASVMEIAGQLGIGKDEKKELTDFTETMVNLGVATNMTAEDAATNLARLANITGMTAYDDLGVSNYERLGSAIVDLGNNFATTEQEIVEMGLNISGAGELVGLSEAQILALSTALSSTGVKAAMGGTAISKTLRMIELAVESNSESLETFANVAGMTSEEFGKLFREDAGQGFYKFIEGLSNGKGDGKTAISILAEDLEITETRLTDALTRMSNNPGILEEALETANRAWDENIALTEEAEKRYETFDSQVSLLKNSLSEMGIKVYDNITRSPILSVVKNLRTEIQGFIDTGMDEWIDNINGKLPTIKRNLDNIKEPLVGGIQTVGGWFVKNYKGIVSGIAAIGGTLVSYKIVSSLAKVSNAVSDFTKILKAGGGLSTAMGFASAFTPIALGAVAAGGALVGLYTHAKMLREELINNSLNDYFGDLTLSLDDLNTIASEILDTDRLSGISKSLEEFNDVEAIASNIEQLQKELAKYDFRIGLGIELEGEKAEGYASTINSYVSEIQNYIETERYAVNVLLKTSLISDYTSGRIDDAYASLEAEMNSLGLQMSEALEAGLEDGILDLDENKIVQDLLDKINNIQNLFSEAQLMTQQQQLEEKYSGELSKDSFLNLGNELAEQYQINKEVIDEAYEQQLNAINLGELTETLSTGKANEQRKLAEQDKYNQLAEGLVNGNSFALGKIEGYVNQNIKSADFSGSFNYTQIKDSLSLLNGLEGAEYANYASELYKTVANISGFNDELLIAQNSTAELLEGYKGTLDELVTLREEMISKGLDVPEAVEEVIAKYDELQFYANDSLAGVLDELKEHLNEDEFNEFISAMESLNVEIPESFKEGMKEDAQTKTTEGIQTGLSEGVANVDLMDFSANLGKLRNWIQEEIDNKFDTPLEINAKLTTESTGRVDSILDKWINTSHHADGGIVNGLELSWLGEEGPEAVIPLDGSDNAMRLWEQTGKLLGLESIDKRYPLKDSAINANNQESSSQAMNITFSPVITIQGNADSSTVQEALRMSYEEFSRNMEQYIRDKQRLGY